ncbi:hypothetical protein TBR22_A48300 [Luteitalea sp. TBR-22]|uniref:hypothetical protein n=1 Tax=Luteitalea sp. TBR-22 TaxID=2802971 RepID=UPI001AF8DB37|nr:hypothetical protein [Luteitalea sp. TBR-22]BCS35596.1 hypothetical protein TBR22_A48300 [Luteitalea sp. TBR-22]
MPINTMQFRAFVAAAAVLCAGAAYAQAPTANDLVGTWNLTLTSPQGTHPMTMDVKEDAGKLVATATGLPLVGTPTIAPTDSGVKISFAIDYQGQPIDIVMTGKVTGAEIKGAVDYAGGAASGDFSGTRAGAAASASTSAAAGVAGVWDITGDGGGGWSLNLKQEGSAVTGFLKSPDGMELPVKGSLEGNALSLNVSSDAASGTVKATLEDGKLVKGNYDIAGNAGSWSATRKS